MRSSQKFWNDWMNQCGSKVWYILVRQLSMSQEKSGAITFGLVSPKNVVFCETYNVRDLKVHGRAEEPFFFNGLIISKPNHS
jgi:hypothetical protein